MRQPFLRGHCLSPRRIACSIGRGGVALRAGCHPSEHDPAASEPTCAAAGAGHRRSTLGPIKPHSQGHGRGMVFLVEARRILKRASLPDCWPADPRSSRPAAASWTQAIEAKFQRRAVSVFIRADVDLLWQRVRGRSGRPLLKVSDPRAALAELHKRRYPIYAEADVTVDSRRGSSSLTVAHDVLASVRVFGRDHPGRQVILESA